jgi:hypothetical protein
VARTFTARAEYVSTRTRGARFVVSTVDGRPSPSTLADCVCTCPGWRGSRTSPATCDHTRRFVSRDQFGDRAATVSHVRACLQGAGHVAKFSEFQLAVLEQVFEPRLARRSVAAVAAAARTAASTAPARAGLRHIVLDDE